MPIYEYRCPPCDHPFEALIRSSSDVPRCPRCGSAEVAKQFSVPAAAQVGGGPRSSSLPVVPQGGGCGAPMCCGGGCSLD
jgi:putative FmdB family regulatory protein